GKFANGAITGAFGEAFNELSHETQRYILREKYETLESKMVSLEEYESQAHRGFLGTVLSLFEDVVGLFKESSFSVDFSGTAYYQKMDLVQKLEVVYDTETNQTVSSTLGPAIWVIDVSGTSVTGYMYIGSGVYSRPVTLVNGFPEDPRNVPAH
ncbi:MAG: hypothetical protein QJR02_11115, partial [Sinobacteraceae bacterium]|nr:hypothetical protein [Nevskiaceae bacterium]